MEGYSAAEAPPTTVGKGKLPPGPRAPAPVQGLRYLRNPLEFYIGLQRRYGDIFTVSMPTLGQVVYVASPELVKTVFTSSPALVHAGEANAKILEPTFGANSLLILDEAQHMRHRKLLLPPFHGDQIRRHGKQMQEITRKQMEGWPIGEPFPLWPETQSIALNVIFQSVFGIPSGDRLATARKVIDDFYGPAKWIAMLPALRRDLGPLSPWRRFLRVRDALHAFVHEEIEIRRQQGEDAEQDSVLSIMLRARDEDGQPMSDEELRDELITTIGAGSETAATTLAWTMERVLRTPRVLAELRDSVKRGETEYLDATLKEALRTRPVFPELMRKLTGPMELGGYELPAGTGLRPAVVALHYREDLFPEPYEFRPERFLDGKTNTYSWIPFGGGVRRCIGAAFAEYEMRIVLREFIERADFSLPDPQPERVSLKTTLTPAKNTVVRLDRPLR